MNAMRPICCVAVLCWLAAWPLPAHAKLLQKSSRNHKVLLLMSELITMDNHTTALAECSIENPAALKPHAAMVHIIFRSQWREITRNKITAFQGTGMALIYTPVRKLYGVMQPHPSTPLASLNLTMDTKEYIAMTHCEMAAITYGKLRLNLNREQLLKLREISNALEGRVDTTPYTL